MNLLAALLGFFLITNAAYADDLAYMSNKSGGKVVLTTKESCIGRDNKAYDGLERAFSFNADGATNEGCYYIEGNLVKVTWLLKSGGSTNYTYQTSDFTMFKGKK